MVQYSSPWRQFSYLQGKSVEISPFQTTWHWGFCGQLLFKSLCLKLWFFSSQVTHAIYFIFIFRKFRYMLKIIVIFWKSSWHAEINFLLYLILFKKIFFFTYLLYILLTAPLSHPFYFRTILQRENKTLNMC